VKWLQLPCFPRVTAACKMFRPSGPDQHIRSAPRRCESGGATANTRAFRAVPVARHFTSLVGSCTHHFTGTPHILLPALLGTTMRGSIMTRYRCSLAIIYPSCCMLGLAFALMIDPTSWTWIRRSHHRTLRRWTCRPDLMCLLPQVVCNPGGEVTCYRYKGSEFQKELS
jgi:hypothetical protein